MGSFIAGYGAIAVFFLMFGVWAASRGFRHDLYPSEVARAAVIAVLWPVTVPMAMVGLI